MKNTIKHIVSIISLSVLISGAASASEEDYGADAYRGSVVHEGNLSLSNDVSNEVDAFTLNSATYVTIKSHKVSVIKKGSIPKNTVFGDPLYYSTNK